MYFKKCYSGYLIFNFALGFKNKDFLIPTLQFSERFPDRSKTFP